MFSDFVDDELASYERPGLVVPPHLVGGGGEFVGDDEDSPAVWRCPPPAHVGEALSVEALESPVYRSVSCVAPLPDHDALYDLGVPYVRDAGWLPLPNLDVLASTSVKEDEALFASANVGFAFADDMSTICEEQQSPPVASFVFNLPSDLFDHVLAHLEPHPDLFASMSVCHAWYQAAVANYQRRWKQVASVAGELSHMVSLASPGDTILLDAGQHSVHSTVTIDVPLRLMATHPGDAVAIVAHSCVAIRSRTNVSCDGLEMRRLRAAGAHPNSVIHAEAGTLELSNCVVLGAEAGEEEYGASWKKSAFSMAELASATASTLCNSPQQLLSSAAGAVGVPPPMPCRQGLHAHEPPQTGVSVGPAARAELIDCRISHHRGPAVKVCRGQLIARKSVISHSACGANVVVNGGRIELVDNDVHSARGDGIASWNNPGLTIEGNRIHSNAGSGIALNSDSTDTTITANHIFGNSVAAVRNSASCAHASLVGNTIEEAEGAVSVSQEPCARACAAIGDAPNPMRLQRSVTLGAMHFDDVCAFDSAREPPPVALRASRSAVDRLWGGGSAFDSD